MNKFLMTMAMLLLLASPLPAIAALLQPTTTATGQNPAQNLSGYSTQTPIQPPTPYFSQPGPGTTSEGDSGGRAPLIGATSKPESQLSDVDKARLLEYRQMSEDVKAKIAKYCMMSDVERAAMDKYGRMSESEKATAPDFSRLSEEERSRVAEFSQFSDMEKARFGRYCSIVDIENVRSSLGEDVSEIEKAISYSSPDNELFRPQPLQLKRLEQFGYNFFRPDSTGFASLTDVPVGDDYLVGPGDRIILQLWGSIDGIHELEVNRSGEVLLPRVGAVKVWGVPFGGLNALFRKNLSSIFKDFQLNVNMGKLRMMKVYIVGEVRSPGDYNVSSLSTVINALAAAGGPTKNGSLRNIRIRRVGKAVETVDLYDFFLKGDRSCDVRLQPGDTIYVPVLHRVAAIGGNVRRPAIFELKDEKKLTDLLRLADGISVTASLQRVQIAGINAHDSKQVRDFSIDPRKDNKQFRDITDAIEIRHMDSVRIFPINSVLRGQVRIQGYALHPGDYALGQGMRVRDLFGKEDILPETYRDVAIITRMLPPDYLQEKITINLGQALAGDPAHNLELKEFDRLALFSRWDMEEKPMVRISGEVQKPGNYRVYERMSLRDLVFSAGNVRQSAYLKNAEIRRTIVDSNGVRTQTINVDLGEALLGNPAHNILIERMDVVTVRRIPDWNEETERYVTLRGEFRFPGVYPLMPGERLSDLIQRAGGYSDRAYLKGAKFSRKLTRELQQKRMEEVLMRAEQDLARKQQELASVAASKEELESTRTAIEGMRASIEKLKLAKAEGRISIQLAPLAELKKSSQDVVLQGGDIVEIPQSTNAVLVYGEVYNPTTLIHLPEKRLGYYLKQSGGCTLNADEEEMYVIKVDGTVKSHREHSGFFTTDGFYSLRLDPGDTLVVPQKLDKIAWIRELKDIATIIGQVALTAGVIIAAM